MLDIHNPLTEMKITELVCASLAILTTVIRLVIRYGRFWWDDACAFFAMLCIMLQIAAVFMRLGNPNVLSKMNKVAAYYIMSTCFSCIIWFARLSILFSLIRVEPSAIRRRRLYVVAVGFFIALVLLMVQLYSICERKPGWKDLPAPACPVGQPVAIAQLITDVISDGILLAAPLQLLRGLQDKRLYRRLVLIFSTCVATTIVSLVHAAYILKNEDTSVIISALVENGISLMVCSLPVVVASILRKHMKSASHENSSSSRQGHSTVLSPSQRRNRPSQLFTTFGGGIKVDTVTWNDANSATQGQRKGLEPPDIDVSDVKYDRDGEIFEMEDRKAPDHIT